MPQQAGRGEPSKDNYNYGNLPKMTRVKKIIGRLAAQLIVRSLEKLAEFNTEEASFRHDQVSFELCPEAEGHFCMLWGDHGHGGYESETGRYVQGGQPADKMFDFLAIYAEFEDVKEENNMAQMRQLVNDLKKLRCKYCVSIEEERSARKNHD